MIPIKLTENHYINPEATDQLLIRPKTDGRPAALCIVFSDDNQVPLDIYGEEAASRTASTWFLRRSNAANGILDTLECKEAGPGGLGAKTGAPVNPASGACAPEKKSTDQRHLPIRVRNSTGWTGGAATYDCGL